MDPFGETQNAEALKMTNNMMFGMTSAALNGLNFGESISPVHMNSQKLLMENYKVTGFKKGKLRQRTQ